jgi:hypothetical protein
MRDQRPRSVKFDTSRFTNQSIVMYGQLKPLCDPPRHLAIVSSMHLLAAPTVEIQMRDGKASIVIRYKYGAGISTPEIVGWDIPNIHVFSELSTSACSKTSMHQQYYWLELRNRICNIRNCLLSVLKKSGIRMHNAIDGPLHKGARMPRGFFRHTESCTLLRPCVRNLQIAIRPNHPHQRTAH